MGVSVEKMRLSPRSRTSPGTGQAPGSARPDESAYHRGMAVRRVVLATLLAVLCSCDSSGAKAGGGGEGTERGACYGNGSCNPGLLCLSNRCVRPPGADCDAVGEHLTSLELGNYAPKEQCNGRVLALAAVCRAQHMTKDEGACLLEKTSKDTLGYCPKPLIVPVMSEDDRKAQTGL